MTRYHISNSGEAVPCDATEKPCPKGADAYHSNDPAEVQAEAERQLEAQEASPQLTKNKGQYTPGNITVSAINPEYVNDDGSYSLPSGEYFIGDPVSAAGRDEQAWDDLEAENNDAPDVAGQYGDYPVVGLSSDRELDGMHFARDLPWSQFNVRSGRIGATPTALLTKMGVSKEEYATDGAIMTVPDGQRLTIWNDAATSTLNFDGGSTDHRATIETNPNVGPSFHEALGDPDAVEPMDAGFFGDVDPEWEDAGLDAYERYMGR